MTPAAAAVLLSLALSPVRAAAGPEALPSAPSFPVREPEAPLALKLSSPALAEWGRTPVLRLIYYPTAGAVPNDVDRRAILRELRLIRDFYAHYGLAVRCEDRVYEVPGPVPAGDPSRARDYFFIKKQLQKRGLLRPGGTIVFTTFDVGLGGGMALTGLNDETVRGLECPPRGPGRAWWCGRPEAVHWGGSVHEVGHMLGLSHPAADREKSVMGRHDLFLRNPDNGLLPEEVDVLYRRYRDPGAPPPHPARP